MFMFPVRIAEQATKSKFFWVDDVWVTGILGTVPTTIRIASTMN
jgi:hypothetical protein